MTDHLQEARDVLGNAEATKLPDRSVKAVTLVSIAHSLIAIAEQLHFVAPVSPNEHEHLLPVVDPTVPNPFPRPRRTKPLTRRLDTREKDND